MTRESPRTSTPEAGGEHPTMRIRAAFAAAWQLGQRPRISEFLADLAGASRATGLRELVALDIAYRRHAGEVPIAAHYVAQFPDDRELIESLFVETKSLIGEASPETLVQQPAGEAAAPGPSADVTQLAARAADHSDHHGPVQLTSHGEDAAKSTVSLAKFSDALVGSGLLSHEEIETFMEGLPADRRPQNGKQLAQELFRCKRLTRFQVHAVYQGKTRGLVVGNYVVLDKLGQGGMGQVYTARHTRMDRVVAIKVLPAAATKSPEAVKRFQREVKAAARLTHPHIVTAYDADEYRGVHFLVMEHVDGQDLASLVREKGPLPVKQAVDCIVQAARGLEYAHHQGVIHRDIKPHNLLLNTQGVVKILDMGLARIEESIGTPDDGLTHSGAVLGTLDYMAPEQALDTKTADVRADIYSLGCTLHFLLTGIAPYGGDSLAAKIVAHRLNPVPRLRAERQDVPEALDEVFRKMLAKQPDDRHAGATEVLQDLANVGWDLHVSDALDVTVAPHNRPDEIDFTEPEAEDPEETPSLDGLSDKSVDLTQRWVAPSIISVSTATSWLSEHMTLVIGTVAACIVALVSLPALIATLRTTTGDLMVEVNEPGATVEVLDAAGQVVATGTSGESPLAFSLEPGQHQLRIQKNGFLAYTRQTDMESGSRTSLTARLEPKPPEQGTLVVKGAEAGSLVELLDLSGKIQATYRTKGPELSIPVEARKYRVRIEHDAAQLLLQDVSVTAKQTVEIDALLAFRANQERKIAAFVLDLGGKLTISVDGVDREVTSVDEFPTTTFSVVKVFLSVKPAVNDDAMKSITSLENVRELILIRTSVTDAATEAIARMPSLTYLNLLASNGVTEWGVTRLSECQTLGTLDLSGLPLTDACLPSIARLENLSGLALRSTQISDEGLKQLWPLRYLGRLCLSGTKITDVGLAHLQHFQYLVSVELMDMPQLTNKGIRNLLNCPSLTEIELRQSPVSDELLAILCENPCIQRLTLDGTTITDQGLRDLERLWNPADISLTGTKVKAAGVRRLGERFPGCQITVDSEPAKSLPPRGQRTSVKGSDLGDESQYEGLAPGRWVTLLPADDRRLGWRLDSGEVHKFQDGWKLSQNTKLWAMTRPRDLVYRVRARGLTPGCYLSIREGVSPGGVFSSPYVLRVTERRSVSLEVWCQGETIMLGQSSPVSVLDESECELALAAIGRKLVVFVNQVEVLEVDDSNHLVAGEMSLFGSDLTVTSVDCQFLDFVTTPTIQQILDAPTDMERETAEWILRLGGTVAIVKGGIQSAVEKLGSLPVSPFSIVRVSMVGAKDLMTDLALTKLGPLPELQSLDLSGIPISDGGLNHLKTARKLAVLDVGGTNVTALGVATLQAALPNCKIAVCKETAYVGANGNWKHPAGVPSPAIAPFDAATAKEHQEAWAKYLNMPVQMTNSIGMKLVLIPPGEFDMGSTQEEVARLLAEAKQQNLPQWYIDRLPGEAPKHRVRLTQAFQLGTCEVTVGHFRQFVADTGYVTEGEKDGKGGFGVDASGKGGQKPEWTWRLPGFEQNDDHPVVQVTWSDAVDFCDWLSRKEGTAYRLPTEAEWEYACGAGSTTKWSFGNAETSLGEYAWYGSNSQGRTHPVGEKKSNALGLHDMHGNVWEWCRDWHHDGYYKNSPLADPRGSVTGSGRVLRGGCWGFSASGCRTAFRSLSGPVYHNFHLGFRVAAVPSGK